MRAYLVKDNVQVNSIRKFAGTQAGVREIKAEMIEAGAPKKGITVEEIDVPMDKAGLLEFLNELVNPKEAARRP